MSGTTHTLGGMVALVERYQPSAATGWDVVVRPTLPARMTLNAEHVTVTVRERTDLELARLIAAERTAGRQAVDRLAVLARRALGWGRGEPYVRCVVCRTLAPASQQHAPGGLECDDTREDRRLAHADWTPA